MRAHTVASLIWPLTLALWCLVPLHDAWSASLAWSTTPSGERLIFKFDTTLPPGIPRQVNETAILVPIKWNYWQRERKPRMTASIPNTALLRAVEFSQEGMRMRFDGPIAFAASANATNKTLVIDLRDVAAGSPNATSANASAPGGPDSVNTTHGDAAEPNFLNATETGRNQNRPSLQAAAATPLNSTRKPLHAPPGQALRGKILRPDQTHTNASETFMQSPAPFAALAPEEMFRVRQPVARVFPEELRPRANATLATASGNQTEHGAPNSSEAAQRSPRHDPAPAVLAENASMLPAGSRQRSDTQNATNNSSALDEAANATLETRSATHGNATDAHNATLVAELQEHVAMAEQAIAEGDLASGRTILQAMLRRPGVPDDVREEVLFMIADILMREGKADLPENFATILDAYETAKNFNPSTDRMPEALASIGYLHLAVGNAPEAKGYFDFLRRRFPDDPHVPMIDYYWGEYYAAHGFLQKAADHFQYALQNYPNSAAAEASAVGLLKSLSDLEYANKAYEMIDTIEKRWPDCRLRYPAFLMAAGYAAMMTDHLDQARDYYWTYYNLYPRNEDADLALVRIGDIFVKQGKHGAARDIFHKAAREYENKEGGLIAQMRLAEEGLLAPSPDFVGPMPRKPELDPETVYSRILQDPQGSLAPVARLKLAMWYLWNKRYENALAETSRFAADYPDHDFSPKNREIENKALREWILDSFDRGNFSDVLKAWEKHGQILGDENLDPRIRLAVATAMLNADQKDAGLDMAKPLVLAKPRSDQAEQALDLMLGYLVELKRWPEVIEITREATSWGLPPDKQRQLDYTAALAHENLDQHQDGKKLWSKLSTDMNLPDERRGYALYFLARNAMASGDVEQAGILAQDTLNLLLKDKTDVPKIKDCLEMLIRAAEASGRTQDALSWALQYEEYLDEADPNWAAFTYRKALLHKKNGDDAEWKRILRDMIAKKPDALYSRMAASELEAQRLEKETQKFR